MTNAIDIKGAARKGNVVFSGNTDKGKNWIQRVWLSDEFETNDYGNAALHIKKMENDGLVISVNFG